MLRHTRQGPHPSCGRVVLLLAASLLAFCSNVAHSFVVTHRLSRTRHSSHDSALQQRSRDTVDGDLPQLQERLQQMRVGVLESELNSPPNPNLPPNQFVGQILEGLLELVRSPTGFRLSSTAAGFYSRVAHAHSSLGRCARQCSRRNGGVGAGNSDCQTKQSVWDSCGSRRCRGYIMSRSRRMCWTLKMARAGWNVGCVARLTINCWWPWDGSCDSDPSDGSWLVDGIDWQDFRDRYRPGIGREEWMRICG